MKITKITSNNKGSYYSFTVVLFDGEKKFSVEMTAEDLLDHQAFCIIVLRATGQLYDRRQGNHYDEIKSKLAEFWSKEPRSPVKLPFITPVTQPDRPVPLDVWFDESHVGKSDLHHVGQHVVS